MPAELWLDSSVAFSPRQTRELARLARQGAVRLLVHAHIHLEQCRQVRVEKGEGFSPDLVRSFLDTAGIEVANAVLDQDVAEAFAARLSVRFPTEVAWRDAKASAVKARVASLLVPQSTEDERGTLGQRIPMTTDWLVALEVEHRPDARIAVEDAGPEWQHLREQGRALTYQQALDWLARLAPTERR